MFTALEGAYKTNASWFPAQYRSQKYAERPPTLLGHQVLSGSTAQRVVLLLVQHVHLIHRADHQDKQKERDGPNYAAAHLQKAEAQL